MSAAHTPGPWHTDGTRIWHQVNPGGRKTYIADLSGEPPIAQRAGNACLLAAATELFAALQYVHDALLEDPTSEHFLAGRLCRAKAALALALVRP